ncbi:hypothetical protein EG68_08612 [Paragonimus skrjabini miyazakii]|uniref:Filamin n=1 Tax=Paragonimus skrjabini miyazakii TaxID=59628 RepID=A0A8S9YAW9_9TREM|nr:hypothetical protein EG68_08612 [Paragonimus skrjabini miyazakii]
MQGEHRVIIKFAGQEIPDSPYRVGVEGPVGDPTKVSVGGPGIDGTAGNCVGRRTYFNVYTQNAGEGTVECTIVDPDGRRDSIRPRITQPEGDGVYLVEYTPKDCGVHQVLVNFAGQKLPESPYFVQVGPPFHPELAYVTGRGVQARGVRAQDRVSFQVHTERCGEQAQVQVSMVRSDGEIERVSVEQASGHLWNCTYVPQRPGKYSLRVLYGGGDVQNSPFDVFVGPHIKSSIKAYGSGLFAGVVNNPNIFTVACQDQSSKIGFSIEGPSEARMDCFNNGDGTARVTYWVSQPGEYAVHILSGDEDIPNSPYMPQIYPDTGEISPDRVRIYGPGVEKSKVSLPVGKPVEFYVDGLAEALPASVYRTLSDAKLESVLAASCYDPVGEKVPLRCVRRSDGTVVYTYTPTTTGMHTLFATIGNIPLKGAPYRVNFAAEIKPDKVRIWGPALKESVQKEPSYFYIDPRDAYPSKESVEAAAENPVSVHITDNFGRPVPVKVSKQSDGTYRADFTPDAGVSEVSIVPMLGDVTAAKGPLRVPIRPPFDTGKIKVVGLESTVSLHSQQSFSVYTAESGVPITELSVVIESTSDPTVTLFVSVQKMNNVFHVSYTPDRLGSFRIYSKIGDELLMEPTIVTVVDGRQVEGEAHMHLDDTEMLARVPVEHVTNVSSSQFNNVTVDQMEPTVSSDMLIDAAQQCDVRLVHQAITTSVDILDSDHPPESIDILMYSDLEPPMADNPVTNGVSEHPYAGVTTEDSSVSGVMHPLEETNMDNLTVSGVKTFHLRINGTGPPDVYSTDINSAPAESKEFEDFDVTSDLLMNPLKNKLTIGELKQSLSGSLSNSHALDVKSIIGRHPPRPFITEGEKAALVSRSSWPQPSPDQAAAKVTAFGPGLEQALTTQTTFFTIDNRNAPTAPLGVTVTGPSEAEIRCMDNGDGTCGVSYTPPIPGRYVVNVVYNSEAHIQGSPFVIPIYPIDKPGLKTDEVRTFGLGVQPDDGVFKASYVKFTVDASAIDRLGEGTVSAILTAPDEERLACQTVNKGDGTYVCSYTPLEEGPHLVEVNYEGVPVPGSPFNVRVVPGCDPTRVKAYGPGLENGPHLVPGERTEFTVDLTGAGQGGLGLAVEGPSEAPIDCRDNRDGTCTVYYTPTEPGAYSVFVRFNDTDVPKSPFYVDVRAKVDPSQVQCYGPGLESGLLRAGWPAYFTVDTKKAGDARLQVRYTPKPGAEMRPAHIQPLGAAAGKDISQPQHYHKITYTPESEGNCQIEVLYDGKHIPGSPFNVQIRKSCEPERVRVMGPGVEGPVLASMPVSFTVDARDAGMGDLTLGLSDPKGQSVPVRVVPLVVDSESVVTNGAVPSVASLASGDVSDTGLLQCTYEPYLVGPHKIHVMFAGSEVDRSPFIVQSIATGRADLCRIKEGAKDVVQVDVENVITVDTSKGGKGNLTCQIVQPPIQPGASATLLPVETSDNKDGTVSVYYTPKQVGQLSVELRYGGQLIPNGEFTQTVLSRSEYEARNLQQRVPIYRPVEFRLPAPRGDVEIESVVILPSGAQKPVSHTLNDDDTITIVYDPVEQGMHELHVNSFSVLRSGDTRGSTVAMPLQGSPYRFYVDSLTTGRVTAYGPGLSHGITNQPAEFTIVTKEAGGGGLSLSVEGPSKAEISCKENSDGTCSVSYLPLAPGKYNITIKFLDQHISGSPFMAKITGDVLSRSQVSMGGPGDIALEALGEDISTLTASVRSASGREESCILKRLPNNRLGISFTPKEVGEHLISVYQAGQHIANSPFRIRISEKEIGDPRRVRVSGPGVISGMCGQPNQFTVDTRDAGYAGLSLSIEGPSKAEIECHDNQDGTCTVIYVPTEPGPYVINVKYADSHVPNSPFYVEISGESSSRVIERITRRREATSITNVGSRCELSLRVSDTKLRDMTAFVTAPSGQVAPCEVVPVDADHYNIKFVPQEMGEHLVTVKHKGINIAGSPFQFTVGPITDGMASKVRAMGPGLQQGLTNQSNEFTIYTREAGAGTLAIAIEGPSKADIDCEERRDGSSAVSYRVSLPGVYTCSLKFNDEHIPFSPFRIYVEDSDIQGRIASYTLPSQRSSPRDLMSGAEDVSSQVGRPIAFTVHHEESNGEVLRAQVHAPSGTVTDAIVQPIDRDQYAVRFVPRESGPHLVYVHSVPSEFAERPDLRLGPNSQYRSIQGSPFRLLISHHAADPGMVHATGEGLRRGKVDQKNSFFVNTANAGSGVLNVTVDGPSKVTLTTEEREEGYAFNYVATTAGTYEITIKYGGNFHIVGSPFRVSGTIDWFTTVISFTDPCLTW